MSDPTPPSTDAADTTTTAGSMRLTDWCPDAAGVVEQRRSRRVLRTGRAVVITLTLVFVGLLGRVYQLQAHPDAQIAQLQDSQIGSAELAAMRGGLIDRTGRVLAATHVGYRLFCDPLFIEDRTIFAETIAYELGYDPVEIDMRLSGRSHLRYVLLDDRMDDAQVDKFRGLDLPGIYIEPTIVRDYPQGDAAGTLLGFVGRDGNGLEGLERQWEERLEAKPGRFSFMRDNKRRRMWVNGEGYTPFEDGENVRLSIDIYIQRIAEQELARTIDEFGADSGQIIVIQPNTGEILALATYPTYDPNHFQSVTDEERRNRPVTDIFEPGSIFKPFVWAGLTEKKVVTPGERVDTTTSGAWAMPNGRVLHDVHGKGLITWHEILKYSSNIGMAKIAQRVDVQDVYDIMRSFGFGRPTGVDLPGEVGGLLTMHEHKGARMYSHGSWPMGQEVGVTGMQMVRAMSVLANGGVMIEPRIESVRPEDEEQPMPRQRVVSERTAHAALVAMRDAVLDGTGKRADSPFYDIFGKTGTAELPNLDTGGYYKNRYMSSFLGGAPADAPRLVVGCFIRDPDRSIGHYGGVVAAPAVRRVIDRSLVYLGVPVNPGQDPADIMAEEIDFSQYDVAE